MSLISEESINSIREKNNIVDVISSYVTLKKTGRSYKGLCPFHREKTPSFVVDAQKQLFHCFGCSEGGNIFNFVMKAESMEFSEAVEFLAKRVGQPVKYISKGKDVQLRSAKDSYLQINKEAANFYHYLLMESEQGKGARKYLKGRSYGKNMATSFKLGYAPPNRHSLTNLLIKKGFKEKEILTLDLAHNAAGQIKDRFFDRLIFPIEDVRGNVVGFGGRALSDKAQPKYLNSSQTPVFHKGKQFYGLNLAKAEIVNNDQAILVEGYTDVISLHKGGYKNAIATLGTALTEDHLYVLSRFCSAAVMLFDSDAAGLKAAERSIEFANATNLELLVAVLPEGDPADFILDKGAAELEKVLTKALPLLDFCLRQIIEGADLSTPKKRLAVINKAFELITSQQNAIVEQEYIQKLAKMTHVPIENLMLEYKKRRQGAREDDTAIQSLSIEEKAENILLAILVDEPALVEKTGLEPKDFIVEQNAELFKLIKSATSKDISVIINDVEDVSLRNRLSALSLQKKPQNIEQAFSEVSKKIKDFALKRRIYDIKNVLEKTNPVDNPQEYDKLFKRLIALEAKRRDLLEVRV